MTDVDITSLHAKNPMDLWKKVYECIFPQEVNRRSDQPLVAIRSGAFVRSPEFEGVFLPEYGLKHFLIEKKNILLHATLHCSVSGNDPVILSISLLS